MSNVRKKNNKKNNSFGLYEILRQPIVQIEFWQYT